MNGVNGHTNGAPKAMNGTKGINGSSGMNGIHGTGFLSFNNHLPRLYVLAEDPTFDETTLQHWRDEGFDVSYHPTEDLSQKQFTHLIRSFSSAMKLGQSFALLTFGSAASQALSLATKPIAHCCALLAYYPLAIPAPHASYPSSIHLTLHLAASQSLHPSFPHFTYPSVDPGFAEHDLPEFDAPAAAVARSRDLAAVRTGFHQHVDLEGLRVRFADATLSGHGTRAHLADLAPDAHVNYVPLGVGGVGRRALQHFYQDFFLPGRPADLKVRLLSRTCGVDRVVDEMGVEFTHTQEVPWLLPGVKATGRRVEVVMVSVLAVRGGKVVSEKVYWDQASVLVQIGALDPEVVPQALKGKAERLPIMGVEQARKAVDTRSFPSNMLLDNW